MSDIAIKVEGLGKKYKIGRQKSDYFRESFALFFEKVKPFGKNNKSQRLIKGKHTRTKFQSNTFWALKDLGFEIKKGEAVGIIGKNGAGKSTLLKILSRIAKPTTGHFWIDGLASSLLEVGTGFHPELTGRENIYLNGTILGMKRREIKSKFDEIIEFSGVERFIDTPVKHYSSGMKVRLAFSVAAHLDPEILIIDEVLAVGDAEFQKKCLGKMEDVTGQGRTVLFVSHNMDAVRRLCNRAIFLSAGKIVEDGDSDDVITQYLNSFEKKTNGNDGIFITNMIGENKSISVDKIELLCENKCTTNFHAGALFGLNLHYSKKRFSGNLKIGFVIRDNMDRPLIGLNNQNIYNKLFDSDTDEGSISITIASLPLVKKGRYYVDLYLGNHEEDFLILEKQIYFFIAEKDIYESGHLPNSNLNTIFCPNIAFNHFSK